MVRYLWRFFFPVGPSRDFLLLAPVDGGGVWWVWVDGRGLCQVVAFSLSGLLRFANLFITISHCAWRRVISDMTFLVKSAGFDFVYVGGRICAIS